MHSHALTCSMCGTVNHIVVEGDISLVEEIRCSQCLEPLKNGSRPVAATQEMSDPGGRSAPA